MPHHTSHSHIAKHYDRLATRYDRRWRVYIRRTLEQAFADLRLSGTERILDVGCGTGEFAQMAMECFPTLMIAGVDVAPGMITVAREKLTRWPQTAFTVAPGETLPFGREGFDVVVCANMLHHVRDPKQVLQECARVLRPGGRLVLVDWCRDFWHCAWFHYWLRFADHSYVKMFRLRELSALIEELTLVTIDARRFVVPPLYGMLRIIARKDGVLRP